MVGRNWSRPVTRLWSEWLVITGNDEAYVEPRDESKDKEVKTEQHHLELVPRRFFLALSVSIAA